MRHRSYVSLLSTVLVVSLASLFFSDPARGDVSVIVKYALDVKSNITFNNYTADGTVFRRHFFYIPGSGVEGHLFLPTPVNACSYIDPPPGGFPVNSTWIALVYDYPSCPSDMVMNVRNAGYRLIIASSRNDSHGTVSNEIRDNLFPVAIVGEEYADYLKENAVSNSTADPILVIVKGDSNAFVIALSLPFIICCLLVYCSCCCILISRRDEFINRRDNGLIYGKYHHLLYVEDWKEDFVTSSTQTEICIENVASNQAIASAEDFMEDALKYFKSDQASARQLLSHVHAHDFMSTCSQHYPKFGIFLLHTACKNGWFDVVKMLVESYSCCDPNIKTYQPSICSSTSTLYAFLLKTIFLIKCRNPALTRVRLLPPVVLQGSLNISDWSVIHCACMYGHLDIVKFLVEHGCDPACKNAIGATPLHFACWEGHLDVVTYLIGRGCNPACHAIGYTPLHLACSKGHLDVVKFLLNIEEGFYLKCLNAAVPRPPPLHLACWTGKLDVVKLLVEQGVDSAFRDRKLKFTPLHFACEEGHLDIVKFLVERGVDLESRDRKKCTPLHIAYEEEHLDIVKFLVEWGVDLESRDSKKCTPLHIACKKGHLDIVKILVERGVDLESRDRKKCTPLHIAYEEEHLDIVKFLVERGVDLESRDSKKCTPLHIACKKGHLDIVKILVERGVDLVSRDSKKRTPLHMACKKGHLDIVKILVERGVDLVSRDSKNYTPLHFACEEGHLDIVKFLVEKDFCTNSAVHKLPPLHLACRKGRLDVTVFLVEQGFDPVSRDSKNYTPLHIACEKGHLDIVKFLVNEIHCNHLEPTVKRSRVTPLHLANLHHHYRVSSFLTSPGVSRQARYEYMSRLSFPPVFKVFVMGNHSVGKSTLVQAIQNRLINSNWFGLFFDQFKTVSGVKPDTAGIIPLSIDSKRLGNITMYDLAGHREYYSSHAAVLEKAVANPGSLLVVVVNLSGNRDEITRSLNYWNCFIENHCSQSSSKPDIVIVGSHADVVESQQQKPKEKATEILNTVPSSLQAPHKIIPINCTQLASAGLNELCAVIGNYCTLFRQEVSTDINVNFLHALLCQEFKNVTACRVSTILASIEMGWDAETLSQYLVTLSDKSEFLYLRNVQNIDDSWMILNQDMLLSEINGTVFAPNYFKQHYDISSSTGVVPFSKIREAFTKTEHNAEMIISFMSHLEFCHTIAESEALLISEGESRGIQQQSEQLLEFCHIVPESDLEPLLNSCSEGESRDIQQQPEQLYFFPALVSNKDLPEESCKSINEKTHCKSGWSCQCVRSHQFLPPRFLHVLLLRLAFLFAIAPEPAEEDETCPVIQRRCNVWKSGIHWLNRDGVEAIVEVVEQNTAVILIMGCLEGREMACVKHRSKVIQTILELKERFCRAVELRESFIHPDQLSYPMKSLQLLPSFTITELASAIAEKKDIVTSKQGHCLTMYGINELLYFEPYACFNPKLLAELFADENCNKEIPDLFYHDAGESDIAHTDLKQALDINERKFAVAVNNAPHRYKGCANLFRSWARRSPNPTYQALRSALGRCSVFCGRNPLLLAGVVPSLQCGVGTASEVHPKESLLTSDQEEDFSTILLPFGFQANPMLARKSLDQDEVLTLNDLYGVLEELHVVRAQWHFLGGSLGVKESTLAAIRAEFRDILNDCLREMLSHWLQVDPRPCWNAIVAALRKSIVNEPQLAQTLETKYCSAKPMAKPTTKPLDQHLAEPKAKPTMKPVAQQDEDHSTVPHITEPMAKPTRKPDAQQDPAEDHSTVPYITKPMAKPRPTRKPVVQELTKRDQQDTTEDHSTVPHITDRPRPQELWCLRGRRGRVVKVVETVAAEWVELAKTLHFDSSVIEHVREQFPQPQDACQEVLRRWLDGQEGTCQPVHWDTLIDSLREAGFVNIAIDLQEAVEHYPVDVITTQL